MSKWVCTQCKGKNVQILVWADANTLQYMGDFSGEEQDNWCLDCEENVELELINDGQKPN